MSNVGALPLYKINCGIQADEDWAISLFLAQLAGCKPVDLTGITFDDTVRIFAPIIVAGSA